MGYFTALHSLIAAALLPLAAFLFLLVAGRRLGRHGTGAGTVATTVAVASFALSLVALYRWVSPEDFNRPYPVEAVTHRWIALGTAQAATMPPVPAAPSPLTTSASPATTNAPGDALTAGLLVDSLTIAMFTILTLLNVLLHLFALGSTLGHKPRVFALLALLNFALLALLLANSLVQTLVFWELMSFAGFLLLRTCLPEGDRSALRFYVMNAIGSAAFLLGVGLLVGHTQSVAGLSFFDDRGQSILSDTVRHALSLSPADFLRPGPVPDGFLGMHWLTWVGICLVVAALARMAQFPFMTWLQGAARAPTPVLALLTASMLAAGLLLLVRIYPILTLDARLVLALVGSTTLLLGVGVALVKHDIRRILTWLTVSQAGYVILFLGAGGIESGILHLFANGFVRTGLFLTAGIIVQSLGSADIRQMGGLWKRFPITTLGTLPAVLALGGAPWLAGSYSTNLGLACVYDYTRALQPGGLLEWLLFQLPSAATYLTALAIGRWWWLIFAGTNRAPKLFDDAHEPAFLTLPLVLLVGFYAGRLYDDYGILPLIGKSVPLVLQSPATNPLFLTGSEPALALVMRQTGWSFLGLGLAVALYVNGMGLAERLRRLAGIRVAAYWLAEELLLDEFYDRLLLPAFMFVARLPRLVERAGRTLVRLIALAANVLMRIATRMERESQGSDSQPLADAPPDPDPPRTP